MSGSKNGLSTRARSENVVLRRVHLRFHTESEKSCMFQNFSRRAGPIGAVLLKTCRSDQDTGRAGKRYGIRDMENY